MAETMYCYKHPNRETALTCASCGKPICVDCVVQTAVAGKCRECARGARNPLTRVGPHHYALALVVAAVAGTIGGLISFFLPFFLLMFFIGPAIGGAIGQAIRFSVGRRFGLGLAIVAAIGILAGLMVAGIALHAGPFAWILRPGIWIYLVFALPAAWWRLR